MLSRRKTITLSATALGVLTAWALAWGVNENDGAEAPAGNFEGRHWGAHRGRPLDRMARHLNLSDEQRAAVEAIMADARTQGEQLRGELATLREEVGAMIRSDGYYEDQVRIQVESKSPVFVELTVLGIRTMNEAPPPAPHIHAAIPTDPSIADRFPAGGVLLPPRAPPASFLPSADHFHLVGPAARAAPVVLLPHRDFSRTVVHLGFDLELVPGALFLDIRDRVENLGRRRVLQFHPQCGQAAIQLGPVHDLTRPRGLCGGPQQQCGTQRNPGHHLGSIHGDHLRFGVSVDHLARGDTLLLQWFVVLTGP